MDELGHYLRLHLTGAAGGIELFSRGERMLDPAARDTTLTIRDELREERQQLLTFARALQKREAPVAAMVAKVSEKVARLKPNGSPLSRGPMDDLVDLEAMRVALAGKLAGYEAMLTVSEQVPGLPSEQLEALRQQALRQHDQVSTLHAKAAKRALAR
ncbi:MAG: hypothetical protein WB508_11730 [Aeromicrobium sp.]|uniref:hypothetical protein n=1 Tax=Aeromicrobium sp. TaxID=1871063 RepID=UPI003C349EAB